MAKKSTRARKAKKSPGRKSAAPKRQSIQSHVRDLMLEAISERNLHLDQIPDLATSILAGSIDMIKNALPASRKSALRQVLRGIDEAWAATAKSSASSVRHAKRYGLRFAKRDLAQLDKRLAALEKEFMDTLKRYASRLGGDLGRELENISAQMHKAGTQIRPAATAARTVLTEQGATLAREIATVGAKASREAIQGALFVASGVLEGAGKALGKNRRTRPK